MTDILSTLLALRDQLAGDADRATEAVKELAAALRHARINAEAGVLLTHDRDNANILHLDWANPDAEVLVLAWTRLQKSHWTIGVTELRGPTGIELPAFDADDAKRVAALGQRAHRRPVKVINGRVVIASVDDDELDGVPVTFAQSRTQAWQFVPIAQRVDAFPRLLDLVDEIARGMQMHAERVARAFEDATAIRDAMRAVATQRRTRQ